MCDVFELAVGDKIVRCVHERGRGIAFRIWPGAQFLVRYFTEEPEGRALTAGTPPFVLELGSGTGLCGLVLAALGCPVVLTDLPDALPALERSAQANPDLKAAVRPLGVARTC